MGAHVVVAEDDNAVADSLAFVLRREGFEVSVCGLASEALERVADASLMILDVGLPDESGFELLRRIRRQSDVPVLMLTSRGDEVDRVVGLELGADDYVVKPFSPREVVARVRAILKRGGRKSSTVEPSGLVHDNERRRIRFRGAALDLTVSEYRILAALLDHPGRVFSRSQLLDAMGDAALDTFERTVDSHIKAIRAKLRVVASDDDLIETRRGFGYSIRTTD
jgi:two-component system, OmpR family, catabolic regulation response regulator CreB